MKLFTRFGRPIKGRFSRGVDRFGDKKISAVEEPKTLVKAAAAKPSPPPPKTRRAKASTK